MKTPENNKPKELSDEARANIRAALLMLNMEFPKQEPTDNIFAEVTDAKTRTPKH